MAFKITENRPQLLVLFVLSSLLTHLLGHVQFVSAAGTTGSETTSSSQPLWSYQVKPNSYVNAAGGQQAHYATNPTIFDAFNGLSQRQGALGGSPFLSILPIILIAAGGMLLLLPFLTMMMASPFTGGLGGYNNGFGYPQVGALSKKRSLADQFGGQRGLIDIIENVSTTIDELTRKYSTNSATNNGQQSNKRAKSLLSSPANEQPLVMPPVNHRPSTTNTEEPTNHNNLVGSNGVSS